jgi:multicomponent Na+:H+ antiporter subunit D
MNTTPFLPLALMVVPFLGALLCSVIRGGMMMLVGRMAGLVVLALGVWLALAPEAVSGWSSTLGGWPMPLGIGQRVDGLSMVFLLLSTLTGGLISIYAGSYFPARKETARAAVHFWPLWLMLWGGLHALFMAGDVFNAYILLEVVGLSSVALVTLSGRTQALSAALRYLFAAMVGSLVFLLGVVFLYGEYGFLDLPALGEHIKPTLPTAAAFALMLFGLLLKTALLPFHFWLPSAHGYATAPVSAILSGLVVKGSYYLVLRVWFELFTPMATSFSAQALGALGGIAILWGSYECLRQKRLKLLVAHSTVAQIGYLFLLFPLTMPVPGLSGQPPWALQAWTGSICQAFSHTAAKAAMFLAVGNIIYGLGSDRMETLREIAGRMPLTTFALALSGVSLMGLPPSGGFVAKWMTLNAVMASGQWWWVPVIVTGGLLTAGYVFLMLSYAFTPATEPATLRAVPRTMEIVALLLALLSILTGFAAEELIIMLQHSPVLFPFEPGRGLP